MGGGGRGPKEPRQVQTQLKSTSCLGSGRTSNTYFAEGVWTGPKSLTNKIHLNKRTAGGGNRKGGLSEEIVAWRLAGEFHMN